MEIPEINNSSSLAFISVVFHFSILLLVIANLSLLLIMNQTLPYDLFGCFKGGSKNNVSSLI